MEKNYSYFETDPEVSRLGDECYDDAARIIGRPCLDVLLLLDRKLVLVHRSVEPMKGLWLSGGRIIWHEFKNPKQYATLTAEKHFGIKTNPEHAHILKQRFVCFSRRPYPETLTWVTLPITQKLFDEIKLDTAEQSSIFVFKSRNKLALQLSVEGASNVHSSLILDLYDELKELNLID